MKLLSSKRDGSALPLVILTSAVLIILTVALGTLVVQWFKIVRLQENDEVAYISCDNAIEEDFNKIYDLLQKQPFAIDLGDVDKSVMDKVMQDYLWVKDPGHKPGGLSEINIKTNKSASASVTTQYFYDHTNPAIDNGNGTMDIYIGILAKANLENGMFKSFGRQVYSSKKFTIKIQTNVKWPELAIASLGDICAKDIRAVVQLDTGAVNAAYNNPDPAISGLERFVRANVYSFGTFPEKRNTPYQYYYGGIMAKSSASTKATSLEILDGSAFTQSFIRTGDYLADDKSVIKVNDDVVAQGIQGFGNNDKIYVLGNAYTFDDLEMNGANSLIGINGSYIGLTAGGNTNDHDNSSAIVNSAAIHNLYSRDSKNSRIVINGDVIVNGATFNIDPSDGSARFKMEGASMSSNKSIDLSTDSWLPAYKEFMSGGTYKDNDSVNNDKNYEIMISGGARTLSSVQSSQYGGFQNFIQVNDTATSFTNFLSQNTLDMTKKIPDILSSYDSIHSNSPITGFAQRFLAANGKMYFMKTSDSTQTEHSTNIERLQHLKSIYKGGGNYKIDYLIYNKSGEVSVDEADKVSRFWDDVQDFDWNQKYTAENNILDSLGNKIDIFRNMLLDFDRIFAKRTLPYNDVTEPDPGSKITAELIEDSSGKDKFSRLKKCFEDTSAGDYVLKYGTDKNDVIDLDHDYNSLIANPPADGTPRDANDYILACNLNPDREIQIDGNFRGLIFSVGKVVLKKGASVNGAIIAAGRGYTDASSKDYVSGSAADGNDSLPRVNDFKPDDLAQSNYRFFQAGNYNAVEFQGDGSVAADGSSPASDNVAVISFPGNKVLYGALRSHGIDLSDILNY